MPTIYSAPRPVTIEGVSSAGGSLIVTAKPVAPIVASGRALGFRQTLATANLDTVLPIPAGAVGVVVTFLASGAPTEGRVAFAANATPITVTGTDTAMGYQPPVPASYQIPAGMTHLHVAGLAAGVVVTGSWLFNG